ncbi:MAG: hypothetical protein Q8P90_04105 [bacterium]|nr:hypothetical protein [bacterium]
MSNNVKILIAISILLVGFVCAIMFYPKQAVSYEGRYFVLRRNVLSIHDDDDDLIWESEEGFKVSNFMIADVDNDGVDELIISVWKEGYYGVDLPFWEEDNIQDLGNHIFVYNLIPDPEMQWGSSTIGYTIKSLDFQDGNMVINGDEYWQWGDFHFERVK